MNEYNWANCTTDARYQWSCDEETKTFCYDMAEALNEAHERRMHPEASFTSKTEFKMIPAKDCGKNS